MFSLNDLHTNTPIKEKTLLLSQHENEDEAEDDVLSLCDVSIYSHDSSDSSSTDSSKELNNDTISDSFEFFTPRSHPKIDEIIFCGKSIPPRGSPMYQEQRQTTCMGNLFGGKIKRSSSSSSKTKINGSKSSSNKWYLVIFGMQRVSVPTKMELADMKCRQIKSGAKSLEMMERNNSQIDKGFSYLVRSLSCKTTHSLKKLS